MPSLFKRLQSDESLMLAYQAGDSSAFEALYRRHKDNLFNFIYRSCSQRHIVEELAQESWTAVIRNVNNYKPDAKFKTYIFSIATTKVIDFWRANRHWQEHSSDIAAMKEQEMASTHLTKSFDPQQSKLLDELMTALNQLPTEQRQAFLLREEGFSQKEIAAITNTGQETVKSRVRYARQQLRTLMQVTS